MREALRAGIRGVGLWVALTVLAVPAGGQELADFDYENLAFRGFGLEASWLWPDKVEPTPAYGVRMDLGYLGPGLRITPTLTYWSSRMKAHEVEVLEERLETLVAREQPAGSPPPSVGLGSIEWSDLALALEAQAVWRVPYGLLTFLGADASVHFLNGAGEAISGTFIEDLLDSVSAGFGLHAGVEYPVLPRLRLYGTGRLELLEDLRWAALGGGVQFQLGPPMRGEEGGR